MNTPVAITTPELKALDLRQRPPRSLRVRLGGYALMARMLDKCRALLAGTNGEYHFDCPLDRQLLQFVGLTGDEVKSHVAKGLSDSEVLAWIQENARPARAVWEIEAWSAYQDRRAPQSNTESAVYFHETARAIAPGRADINSWADLLDLDDHVSFGGSV